MRKTSPDPVKSLPPFFDGMSASLIRENDLRIQHDKPDTWSARASTDYHLWTVEKDLRQRGDNNKGGRNQKFTDDELLAAKQDWQAKRKPSRNFAGWFARLNDVTAQAVRLRLQQLEKRK